AERLTMAGRQKQEFRIGRGLERRLGEAKVSLVHRLMQCSELHPPVDDGCGITSGAQEVGRRHDARLRLPSSDSETISGTTANTGNERSRATSSSHLKLESRYSKNPDSSSPRPKPAAAPIKSICGRFGRNGRSGILAGSRTLNCSPTFLRS